MAATAVTDIYTVVLEVDASSGVAMLKQTETALGSTAASAEKVAQRFDDMKSKMQGADAAGRTKLRTIEGLDGAITRLVNQSMTPYEKSLRAVERAEDLAARARKLGSEQADAAAAAVDRLRQRTDALAKAANDNATATVAMAARMDELRAKFDPAFAAAQRLTAEIEELAEAERLGVEVAGGYAAALDRLAEKHDAGAIAAKKNAAAQAEMIAAAKAAQAATSAQAQINTLLGVDKASSGSAAASARVFEEANAALERRAKILNSLRLEEKTREADRWQAMLDEEARSAAAAAAAEQRLVAETQALKDKLNPLLPLERARNEEIARATQLTNQFRIGEQQKAAAIALANRTYEEGVEKLRRTGQIATEAGGAVKLAAHQWTNLSYQIQDVAVQLGSGTNPFVVMLQQGPQATGAVGGLGNALKLLAAPWTAAAAAAAAFLVPVVAGIARAVDLASETRALGVSIQGMGKAAEVSTGQLSRMVEQLRAQGIAAAEARRIATASISSPLVSPARGGQLAGLASDVGAGRQIDAAAAMDRLVEAAARGYEGIRQLDEAWGFLTQTEANAIRDMSRAGDTAKALDVAIAALHRRFDGLHKGSLSPLDKALIELSSSWRGLTTAMAESSVVVGVISDLASGLDTLSRALNGDWNRLAKVLSMLAAAPGNPVGPLMQLAGKGIDALDSGPQASGPAKPNPADYARARRDASGQQPSDPTDAQRGKRLDDYVDAQERELRVLRAGLPDRARLRAELAAEDIIKKEGLNTTQAAALKRAMATKVVAEESDALQQEAAARQRSTVAALAQVDAWDKGAAAAAAATARAQAIEINETKARINVEAWTKAILNNNAAQRAAELSKRNDELAQGNAHLVVLIDAEKKGAAAVAEVELAERKRLATREAMADLANATDPKVRDALEYQIKATEQLIDSDAQLQAGRKAAAAERARSQDIEIAKLQQSVALETDPSRIQASERSVAIRQEELRLMEQYPGQQQIINDLLKQYVELYDIQSLTKFYEQVEGQARSMAGDMKSFLIDAFTSVDQKGGSIFRGLFDGVVKMAKRAAANVAASFIEQKIFIPLSMAVVGSMPGLFGISTPQSAGGGMMSSVGGMAQNAGTNWLSKLMPGPQNFLPKGFLDPFDAKNFMNFSGLFGSSSAPYMGSYTPAMLEVESLGLGLGAGQSTGLYAGGYTAAMLEAEAAGLGLGAGQTMGGGAAVGSGASSAGSSMFGAAGAAGPLAVAAAAIIALYAAGAFENQQKPRGNAQFGALEGGRFTAGLVTGLDGYDTRGITAERDNAMSVVNGLIDGMGLKFNETDYEKSFHQFGGLGGIGPQFGFALTGEDWLKRLFAWNTNAGRASGGVSDLSQGVYQLEAGIGTRVINDTGEQGGQRVIYIDEKTGEEISGETFDSQYAAWMASKDAAFGKPGSLFSTDNKSLQALLDRMSMGQYAAGNAKELGEALGYASNFDKARDLAQYGAGSKEVQAAAWKDSAKAEGATLTTTVKDFMAAAVKYFGAGSTQATQAGTMQRQTIMQMMGLKPDGTGPMGDPTALTGADAAIAEITERYTAYKDALVATGMTAEEATAAIQRGIAARTAEIRKIEEEANRRTKFGFDQREAGAKLAVGGYGVDAQAIARGGLVEQHRQEYFDAEAAGMKDADLVRLKYIQGLEEEALKVQQIEGNRRTAEGFIDRQNAAMVAMGQKTQAEADTEALVARQRQERWDAERSGMSAANREMLFHTQGLEREALAYAQAVQAAQEAAQKAAGISQSLNSVMIAGGQAGIANAQKGLDKATTDVAKAEQDLADARNAVTQAIGEQIQAQQALVSGWSQAATSLKSVREQLLVGQLSPRDPYQQMLSAQGLYQSAKIRAGSDPAVAAQLGAYAQQYLQTAMAYLGPNEDYARIFDDVTGTLQNTETIAQAQARLAQSQLDVLKASLPDIKKDVMSIEAATAKLATAQTAQTAAQAGVTTAEKTMNANLSTQFDTLAGQASAYFQEKIPQFGVDKAREYTETQFGGTRDSLLNAITDWKTLNAIGEKYYKNMTAATGAPEADMMRVKVYQLGGVPTFERGGFHAGGLRLVGEAGPELEVTGPARYWSAMDTRAMLSPGMGRFDMPRMPTMAANDQTAALLRQVVDRLDRIEKRNAAVEKNTSTGNRIAVAAGEANVEGLSANARKQAATERAVKRAGVRR